jgi:polyisoprenyl-teichoic acid--peptidoglycan teichoic acid transferase
VATITAPMARGDKPYRVYRGGRAKGRVPLQRRVEPTTRRDGRRPARAAAPARAPASTSPRRRRGWGPRVGTVFVVLVLLTIAWAVASYVALGNAVGGANERLGPVALDGQSGLLLSDPTATLLLGTDHGPGTGREGARRSDSIILVRTDPGRGRTAYLSIPRDLRVDVPGRGSAKVNAAYQFGGPDLAVRTVRNFTGLRINHVAVVDFRNFEQLIDALGGVTIDVPEAIVSNRFDCPYPTRERCERWSGWRFTPGEQEMDGRRALTYSRIRENRLNPAENDLSRGERQQQVVRAIGGKITSFGTLVRMPLLADDLIAPLATDLSASELAQLAWVGKRAGRTLRCRLGGTPTSIGGESALAPAEENRAVVLMFLGVSAPQPPPPQYGLFGPGCVVR